MGTSHIQTMYQDIAGQFPLPEDTIALYEGPGTTRERHPLIIDSYQNGFKELIVRLAGKICFDNSN